MTYLFLLVRNYLKYKLYSTKMDTTFLQWHESAGGLICHITLSMKTLVPTNGVEAALTSRGFTACVVPSCTLIGRES